MTAATIRDVAQKAVDAINAHDFSLAVEAVRVWSSQHAVEDVETGFLLTVSPAAKRGNRLNRAGSVSSVVPVSFVLQRGRFDDTINSVEADDEIADLMQEIEEFILTTELTLDSGTKANVSGDYAVEFNEQRREAGIFALDLTVSYLCK